MASIAARNPARSVHAALAARPRLSLALLPTPLADARPLTARLGRRVLIKRDDLTGLGAGGNKVRKLEFLLADAQQRDARVILTGGGPNSNHVALTALAAARCGFDTRFVLYGNPPENRGGNLLLQRLSGCEPTYTGSSDRSSVDRMLSELEAELKDEGQRPYLIPRGGATAVGSLGYVEAGLELGAQLAEREIEDATAVVAVGSCGTQAGLEVAAPLHGRYRVYGVTVSRPRAECLQRVQAIAGEAAEMLGLERPRSWRPTISDAFIGGGYGEVDDKVRAAIRTAARTEGVLLDPVFTAKAMAAVLAGAVPGSGPIVFLHTGGSPTLFARYAELAPR